MRKKAIVGILTVFVILFIYLLAAGSELLIYPLLGDPYVPLGTLSTWLFFLFLPLIILLLSKPANEFKSKLVGKTYHGILYLSLVLALLWPFTSYFLAGNFAFNFSNTLENWEVRLNAYWTYTTITPLLPVAALLFLAIYWVVRRVTRSTGD
jgi:hypothetical protein